MPLSDLKSLDGEHDLSDSGITSLRGAEHCPVLVSLNLTGLADGNYRVKDLTLSVDTVLFKYGPNKFALPHAVKISAGIPAESAQIDIRKGTVVSIQV